MKKFLPAFATALAFAVVPADAVVTITGTVTALTIYKNGAITFSLIPASNYCANKFVIQATDVGRPLEYTSLLQAKALSSPVSIVSSVDTAGCVAMTGVTGTTYIGVDQVQP